MVTGAVVTGAGVTYIGRSDWRRWPQPEAASSTIAGTRRTRPRFRRAVDVIRMLRAISHLHARVSRFLLTASISTIFPEASRMPDEFEPLRRLFSEILGIRLKSTRRLADGSIRLRISRFFPQVGRRACREVVCRKGGEDGGRLCNFWRGDAERPPGRRLTARPAQPRQSGAGKRRGEALSWDGTEVRSGPRTHGGLFLSESRSRVRRGASVMPSYHPQRIEPKWQAYWEQNKTFRARDLVPDQPKLYVLDMFPYPSGGGAARRPSRGLHRHRHRLPLQADARVQRPAPDGLGRLRPARRAVRRSRPAPTPGSRPRRTSTTSAARSSRSASPTTGTARSTRPIPITTSGPSGSSCRSSTPGTTPTSSGPTPQGRPAHGQGPADRRAADPGRHGRPRRLSRRASGSPIAPRSPSTGAPSWARCWPTRRSSTARASAAAIPVVRMPLRQWMLRITAYAERLVDDLEPLDWPRAIKDMQRNWIGRSEGAEVDFHAGEDPAAWEAARSASGWPATPGDDVIRVFTTRPDTLFGATYMVLAPEHPLVDRLTTPEQSRGGRRLPRRPQRARATSTAPTWPRPRPASSPARYAINPVNGQRIPIWIADYVLMGYGTGAIMAVPGHDERDFEFATSLRPADRPRGRADARPTPPRHCRAAEPEPGVAVNSRNDDDRASTACRRAEAKAAITAWLEAKGLGRKTINYKLRDWLFSRQRYWGEPFPIVLDERRPRPRRPRVGAARPAARPGRLQADGQARAAAGQGGRVGPLRREIPPRDQHDAPVGRLVLVLPPLPRPARTTDAPWDPELESYWMPVDLYVGGAEHAVLHLLYSRFWHKVLFDRGHVSTPEPFQKLVNQGMILGETEYTGYRDDAGRWVSAARVEEGEAGVVLKGRGPAQAVEAVRVDPEQVVKKGDGFVLADDAGDPDRRPRPQDVEEPGQRHQSRRGRRGIRRRQPPALRDVHGAARGGQALEHEGRRGRLSVPRPRLADDRRRRGRRGPARPQGPGRRPDDRAGQARRADRRGRDRRPRGDAVQHGDQPADGVHQRLHGPGGPAEVGDGDLHPAARADGPARRRGTLGGPRPRARPSPTSPGRPSTRRC